MVRRLVRIGLSWEQDLTGEIAMCLELRLPSVEPDGISEPRASRYPKCVVRHFRLHQVVAKPVRDTDMDQRPNRL